MPPNNLYLLKNWTVNSCLVRYRQDCNAYTIIIPNSCTYTVLYIAIYYKYLHSLMYNVNSFILYLLK